MPPPALVPLLHLRLFFLFFILIIILLFFFLFFFFFFFFFYIFIFFFSFSQTVEIETRPSTSSSLSSLAVPFDEHFDRLRIVDVLRKRIHRTFEVDELARKSIDKLKKILHHLDLDEDGEEEELISRLEGAMSVRICFDLTLFSFERQEFIFFLSFFFSDEPSRSAFAGL